ncbi:TIGR00269 family protein [archaeon]|nr:TIGR00269 family protein [archaeon]
MTLEKTVKKTIEEYELANKTDRIAVACSGGKDSTTVLHVLNKLGYNTEALIIDLLIGDWSKKNLENLTHYCKQEKILLHVVSTREKLGFGMCHIKEIAKQKLSLADCTTCGIIKKWLINNEAHARGFDYVATGHNLDDEAQTVLMNIMQSRSDVTSPKSQGTQGFIPRIKPLYYILEKEIEQYSKKHKFPVLYEPCPYSTNAFRKEVRAMLDQLETIEPGTKRAIVDNAKPIKPNTKISKCKHCGNPCRNNICNACKIMEAIHD